MGKIKNMGKGNLVDGKILQLLIEELQDSYQILRILLKRKNSISLTKKKTNEQTFNLQLSKTQPKGVSTLSATHQLHKPFHTC